MGNRLGKSSGNTNRFSNEKNLSQELIDASCDVGPRSNTPLSTAAGINDSKCLDLLLKSGADVNVRDVLPKNGPDGLDELR